MQLKIQTNPKESSMVELFYLKFDWFHNALGEYMEQVLVFLLIGNIKYRYALEVITRPCYCSNVS
jgi:hypothetical protein